MQKAMGYVVLAALALAGCGKPEPPLPDGIYEDVTISTRKIGNPFELQGCRVQAYRAIMNGPFPDASIFVADCPTATVISEHRSGKSEALSATVRPKAPR